MSQSSSSQQTGEKTGEKTDETEKKNDHSIWYEDDENLTEQEKAQIEETFRSYFEDNSDEDD